LRLSRRYIRAGLLASTWFLGAAAPSGAILSGNVPNHLAETLTQRALERAAFIGLVNAERLGTPYSLSRGAKTLGVLVLGRGTDGGLGGHSTCFVAMIEPGSVSVSLIPTIGRGRWPEQNCHGYTAIGLLPSRSSAVRLAILYDRDTPPTTAPVVLAWHDGQPPTIDIGSTMACVGRHVTTVAEMRRANCGASSDLERAFQAR
jgi:hypothetical protein